MKRSIQNVSRILILFCLIFLVTSCESQFLDRSLKTKSYDINESKVKNTQIGLPHSDLTGVYNGIDDMYSDSDYVVSGVVKKIEYFEVENVLLRKINVLVNKSYKGNIMKNTLISILEHDGYIRLKSLYEKLKKAYEEKNGDKEKEAAFLYGATYMSDIEDIKNDMLIRYTYKNKEDSKIGDELLLFLTDSSDDTYKNKKVKLALGDKLSYPKGAYAALGLWMGKFTKTGDSYKRCKWYYTTEFYDNGKKVQLHQSQTIRDSYTVEEMEDEINKFGSVK